MKHYFKLKKLRASKFVLGNLVSGFYLTYVLTLSGCSGGTSGAVTDTSLFATPTPCTKNSISSQPCLVEKSGTAITDSIGANVTQWSNNQSATTLSVDIPNGYYSDKKVIFDDSNLVSSNIKAGVTIFGVTGNASGILGNCTTNGLQSANCSAAANSFWTTVLGANVSGANGSLSAIIPAGYYDGSKSTTMSDTNLLASNIKFGTTIFGVAGSLTSVYPTCQEDNGTINGTACSTGAINRYVSSVLGSNITSGSNAGATTTVSATIPNGYYNGKTVSFTDANLVAGKIVSGNTIFGVAGSATAAYAACTDNALNGSQCSTVATNRYVTPTAGVDVSIWTNTLGSTTVSASLPDGFYNSKSCLLTDANLLATNIRAGTSVFGVTGSLNSTYSACQEDNGTINGAICTTSAANRYISSVLGANTTIWTNVGATTTVTASLTNGYYNGKSCQLSDAGLIAANISAGTSIFGVSGTATLAYANCSEDSGTNNAAKCSTTAANRYVSSVLGNNITTGTNGGATTTVSATIPDGYYKTKTVSFTDANLVASKILNGTTIFGVTGNVVAAFGACTDNALNGSQCSTAASRYVSPTLGTNITVSAGTTATITKGYYDGTKSCNVSDANLAVGNIKSGVTILGVTGTLASAYAACSDDNYNAGQCSTAAARYVTATLGSAISSWTNVSSGTTVSGTIPGGFYPTSPLSISFNDANLLASNIISGKTIFNVAGTANVFISNVHRDKATTEITQQAETTTYAGASLPAGYRDTPDIDKDDDGYVSAGVTSPQITLSTRPSTNCGTTQNTISARISDCVTQNGANATWDGTTKGNAGQSIWKLVTRSAANKEVWQDTRTGLLWSSVVSTSSNWCLAAGNGQTTGNGYASNDVSGYCNTATYQSNYVNNTTPFSIQSWCAETNPTGATMVPVSGNGENWGTPTYVTAKGGMGKTASASSPSVRWRLPTKYDYQQADNDGIRFVMPEMATTGSGYEWSASVTANNRLNAWNFNGAYGGLGISNRNFNVSVRCVGR